MRRTIEILRTVRRIKNTTTGQGVRYFQAVLIGWVLPEISPLKAAFLSGSRKVRLVWEVADR